MNECRGAHLICYLSEGAIIRGGREGGVHLNRGAHQKMEGRYLLLIFQTKTERLKNKKGKHDLYNLEIITECVCKFPY